MEQNILSRFSSSGESWEQLSKRVSSIVPDSSDVLRYIVSGKFIPAGQILRGAGLTNKVLYNSFVTSIDKIEASKDVAQRVTSWTELGCGVGLNVTDWVTNQQLSSKEAFETIVKLIGDSQQGLWEKGISRTATMICIDFEIDGIDKVSLHIANNENLRHLNIGVTMTDQQLLSATISGSLAEGKLLNLCRSIWSGGNPGIIFIDRVNESHPFEGEILNSCNSCAEQFLLPNEGCCLGSINLTKFAEEGSFNWNLFQECIFTSVKFLDSVIDESEFPNKAAKDLALRRRRIGLGVMGLASAFDKLGIPYSSKEAISYSKEISEFLKQNSVNSSKIIGEQRGIFKDFNFSTIEKKRRNAYLNSIAPTGAISMIFENSSGIEPFFGLELFKSGIKVKMDVTNNKIEDIYDINAYNQIDVLRVWQRNIDGGISKTVNVSEDITPIDIFNYIVYSWKKQCKAISLYRNNSRPPAFKTTA